MLPEVVPFVLFVLAVVPVDAVVPFVDVVPVPLVVAVDVVPVPFGELSSERLLLPPHPMVRADAATMKAEVI